MNNISDEELYCLVEDTSWYHVYNYKYRKKPSVLEIKHHITNKINEKKLMNYKKMWKV